jgi:LysR family transcriptional regulator, flagellar master operon regulator
MDTELLKTFMEVSRTRHFGRAAENLYLTQSAVSFRVRQLESLLGVELFSRQRNNIQLTAAGERLLPLAENSVKLELRIRHEVARVETLDQPLGLGAVPVLWEVLLHRQLSRILADFNELRLTAVSHSSGTLVRQLLERSLDLAFLLDAPKVDELTAIEVLQLPLHFVSTTAGRDLEAALSAPVVQLDWGVATIGLLTDGRNRQLPVLSTNSVQLAMDVILQQGGSAYLPSTLVESPQYEGVLFPVAGAPVVQRPVFATFLSGRVDDTLLVSILQKITALAPELVLSDPLEE